MFLKFILNKSDNIQTKYSRQNIRNGRKQNGGKGLHIKDGDKMESKAKDIYILFSFQPA